MTSESVEMEQASRARLLKKREVQTEITDLCNSIKIQQHINSDKTVAKGLILKKFRKRRKISKFITRKKITVGADWDKLIVRKLMI